MDIPRLRLLTTKKGIKFGTEACACLDTSRRPACAEAKRTPPLKLITEKGNRTPRGKGVRAEPLAIALSLAAACSFFLFFICRPFLIERAAFFAFPSMMFPDRSLYDRQMFSIFPPNVLVIKKEAVYTVRVIISFDWIFYG